jgi:hypothetical protein
VNAVWAVPYFDFLVCEFVLHLARDCINYVRRFIRFVLMSLLHARICGVLVGRYYED